jgi:cell division protein FtsB
MPALVLTRTGLGLTDYAVRLIVIGLTVLLILIQYPLWLGKGSWLRVWDLSRQLDSALVKEQELRERNAKLASEVQDLKEGTGALEERARYELGLIKDNETFVQILEGEAKKTAPTAPPTPSTAKP